MQVSEVPGSSVPFGQATVDDGAAGAVMVSVTAMPLSVTLPVFDATKEYVTLSPPADSEVELADFTSVSLPAAGAVTVVVVVFEVTVADFGSSPVAVAESTILPLSMSAWVAV